MKNLIKISLIAVAFLAFSCNKEIIKPNTPSHTEEIVLKCNQASTPDNNKGAGDPGITDPNNDPDMNIKKVTTIKSN